MNYIGDYLEGQTVNLLFTTNNSAGGRVEPSTAFESADIRIYKNTSATQRSSEAGIVMTSPFDSMVGVQALSIDLSDNTDAGFYAAGNDYTVVLYPDETVDSQNISKVLAQFSIENRNKNISQVGGEALNALVSGKIDVSVGAMSNNVITAASIAANAIDADAIADNAIDAGAIATGAITSAKFAAGAINATAIATNAIDADAVAADAVTKIQSGLATPATAADAVWDEARSGHVASGSFGQYANANLTYIEGSATVDGVSLTTMLVNMIARQQGNVVRSSNTYTYKKQDGSTTAFSYTVSAGGRS